jgi:calpain-7
MYPWDHDNQTFALSANGRYILRFYFNGCWRRVEIDDLLPTSKTERVLHVIDRRRPGLLWPALVEKAYLKVRGGYDFPGSNSGTDLAVITGWIPEQIFLHDDDVDPEGLWKELLMATKDGHAMITLGTGKLSKREQKHLGLAAEHDYAVLELKERGAIKEMLIKNPWADGDVWKGAARRRPNPSHDEPRSDPPIEEASDMIPGTFWMPFNGVFQYFENLYVNWNPGLFDHRSDMHFTWMLDRQRPAATILDDHHQFVVVSSKSSEVWLLLNRHFRTGDYTHANSGRNGYISIFVFDKDGRRVLSREGAVNKGPFVDSPNTLVRFEAGANKPYTVVVLQAELPQGKHNFTLSLFSHCKATLEQAPPLYPHKVSLDSQWTWFNAGGSSDSPHYLTNPQFGLSIPATQQIAFILRIADSASSNADNTPIHVKVAVLGSDGKRVTRIRARDLVAHSGDYRRGSTVVEKTLQSGNYTVIVSTFDQQQLSPFTLDFCHSGVSTTSSAPTFEQLPAEDAGRHRIQVPPAIFTSSGTDRMLLPLTFQRTTQAIFVAGLGKARRMASGASSSTGSSLFKLSLEQGQGPYKQTIADSSHHDEEYHAISAGLRIDNLRLHRDMQSAEQGGLWLVLERLAHGEVLEDQTAAASRPEEAVEAIQVEILTELRVDVGAWGTGQG